MHSHDNTACSRCLHLTSTQQHLTSILCALWCRTSPRRSLPTATDPPPTNLSALALPTAWPLISNGRAHRATPISLALASSSATMGEHYTRGYGIGPQQTSPVEPNNTREDIHSATRAHSYIYICGCLNTHLQPPQTLMRQSHTREKHGDAGS